ncbi:Crp/Fnr family transcriptional regulator [Desulfosoma caldarium]|uniref:Cyclic nucleotide-binding protein n=1 Tax=Desulfosoma caldarium TaxID=610254 RepID=A0A3N1UTK1_9BACT|nr:Crp/Fnr family transcriptional regulator [Desulfosoma caldarium]ROQ92040.1 cyclic nucleotide-binding protein [Desulfosoma caldarium]
MQTSQPKPAETLTCELDDNLEWLRRTDVFSSIPLERLRVYALMCHRRRFRRGEFLFRQGQPDDKGYILVAGTVQMVRQYENHSVIVHDLEPGAFFGGLALLANIQRLFGARAATDVDVLYIDRETFRKILHQFPDLMEKILDVMIRRIVLMEEKILERHLHECVLV